MSSQQIAVHVPSGSTAADGSRSDSTRSTRSPRPSPVRTKTTGSPSHAAASSTTEVANTAPPASAAAAQAEDGEQERREEDLDADDDQRRGEHREPLLRQLAEPAVDPDADDPGGDRQAQQQHRGAEQEPVLEPE